MRAGRQRPRSQHGGNNVGSTLAPQAARKIFNCIVDDTALVAGVKKTTRNGIRQWVKNGQIRLFVPLHALEQLSRQKAATSRHGEDVRETLQWLDDATTRYPHAVTLQGGDQYYPTWAEVERYAIPRTLFSESDHMDQSEPESEPPPSQGEALTIDAIQRLALSGAETQRPAKSADDSAATPSAATPSSNRSEQSAASPLSPPTSPTKASTSPEKSFATLGKHTDSTQASVPVRLQSLFNYIIWRVHQELDPIAALESFIFLCNDPNKVNYARGFDIRYKRLEQLRDAIGREDRDFRNRQMVQNREIQDATLVPIAKTVDERHAEDDEDNQVLFRPATRTTAGQVAKEPQQKPPQPVRSVMDPNAFSRGPTDGLLDSAKSPTLAHVPHSPQRNSTPRSPRNAGRSNGRGGRGRGAQPAGGRGTAESKAGGGNGRSDGQIDPDSFARPRGPGNAGRGGRKLWVPS